MSISDELGGLGVYLPSDEELGPRQGARPALKKVALERAGDILGRAAETFRERSAIYGHNYLRFGHVFRSLFPGGVVPAATTDRDMDRLQLLMQLTNKLTRYAEGISLNNGGHKDSAHDMIVYAAMLEEVTDA